MLKFLVVLYQAYLYTKTNIYIDICMHIAYYIYIYIYAYTYAYCMDDIIYQYNLQDKRLRLNSNPALY